jgi:hypothetical protein
VRTPAELLERKSKGPRKGSKRAGAGRKKGTPNKITADVKAGVTLAFSMLGPGVPGKSNGVEGHKRRAQRQMLWKCWTSSRC